MLLLRSPDGPIPGQGGYDDKKIQILDTFSKNFKELYEAIFVQSSTERCKYIWKISQDEKEQYFRDKRVFPSPTLICDLHSKDYNRTDLTAEMYRGKIETLNYNSKSSIKSYNIMSAINAQNKEFKAEFCEYVLNQFLQKVADKESDGNKIYNTNDSLFTFMFGVSLFNPIESHRPNKASYLLSQELRKKYNSEYPELMKDTTYKVILVKDYSSQEDAIYHANTKEPAGEYHVNIFYRQHYMPNIAAGIKEDEIYIPQCGGTFTLSTNNNIIVKSGSGAYGDGEYIQRDIICRLLSEKHSNKIIRHDNYNNIKYKNGKLIK